MISKPAMFSDDASEPLGVLSLKFIQGKLHRNTEFFGEMDPFMQVVYKDRTYKTSTIKDGGKNPVWNEVIAVQVD